MTIYVFDSGPFIDLFNHYYPERFPTLWEHFDSMVARSQITSTREVFNELVPHGDELSDWCKDRRSIFATPTPAELEIVTRIFGVSHFQAMIRKQERMNGRPVADPFVIARACSLKGCVVTAERGSPNAAKIPNVCDHFGVECTDWEGFMAREGWIF